MASGLLHLLGRVTDGGWLALASAAVLVLPVVALVTRPRLRGLHVQRELHGQPVVGQRTEVTLTLTNLGDRLTAPVVVTDVLPGHDTLRVSFPSLRPGGHASLRMSREATARTSTGSVPVRLTASAPIGLVQSTSSVLVPGHVVVHPHLPSLRRLPDGVGGPGTSSSSVPVAGIGTEVLGLREWRHGESARAVSARASARHGRPLVLEREQEGAPSLVVLVGAGRGADWEAHLSLAAAYAVAALRDGRRLVLRGLPGSASTPHQVLDAFAAADAAPPLDGACLRAALADAGPGGVLVLVPGQPHDALARDLDQVRQGARRLRCGLVELR